LTVILLENGIYEVTGGQKTAASNTPADLAGFASSAGFPYVRRCASASRWRQLAPQMLAAPGPRFMALTVQPTQQDRHLAAPEPMGQQVARMRRALSRG
jgi:hypothetical protein